MLRAHLLYMALLNYFGKMYTHIIYRKELFIKSIAYILIVVLLGLGSTYLLKSRVVSIVLLICMVLPLLFIQLLFNKFKKKVCFQFYEEYFTETIFDKKEEGTKKKVNLDELKSYSILYPNDRFQAIKLRLKNGKSFEYSFFQKIQDDKDIDTTELVSKFHTLIKDYNKTLPYSENILFLPSFIASKNGLILIIVLVLF